MFTLEKRTKTSQGSRDRISLSTVCQSRSKTQLQTLHSKHFVDHHRIPVNLPESRLDPYSWHLSEIFNFFLFFFEVQDYFFARINMINRILHVNPYEQPNHTCRVYMQLALHNLL